MRRLQKVHAEKQFKYYMYYNSDNNSIGIANLLSILWMLILEYM